jgi:hypothetical protein
MPVQETLDGVAELTAAGLAVGGIVVNQVRSAVMPARRLAAARKGRLDRDEVGSGLRAAGLSDDDDVVDGLLEEAARRAARVALERRERQALDECGRPVYELPELPGGVDLGALYQLAELLHDQGMS